MLASARRGESSFCFSVLPRCRHGWSPERPRQRRQPVAELFSDLRLKFNELLTEMLPERGRITEPTDERRLVYGDIGWTEPSIRTALIAYRRLLYPEFLGNLTYGDPVHRIAMYIVVWYVSIFVHMGTNHEYLLQCIRCGGERRAYPRGSRQDSKRGLGARCCGRRP